MYIKINSNKRTFLIIFSLSVLLVILGTLLIVSRWHKNRLEYVPEIELSKRETIVLSELKLTNDEERYYDNKELIIKGDILLQDNSKLEIRNSNIVTESEFHKQYSLEVHDNSTFIVNNCSYESTEWRMYNFEYFGESTIIINDFEHEEGPWQTISENVRATLSNATAGFTIAGGEGEEFVGELIITESDYVYFELDLPPVKPYDLTLPNGFIEEWAPDYYQGTIKVSDSTITNIDIDLWPGVDLTIRDSKNFNIGWIFGNGWGWGSQNSTVKAAEVSGLRKGYYKDKTIEADNAKLRMINTEFESWWPITTGDFILTVRDCDMIDPWAYNESTFIIHDSDIYYMSAANESTVRIYNSIIQDSLVALDNARIELYNTDFEGEISKQDNARVIIDGNEISK